MGRSKVRIIPNTKEENEIKSIINAICVALDLDVNKLYEKNTTAKYVEARYIAVYIIRSKYGKTTSYKYISGLFNRNTHLFAFQAEMFCKDWISLNKDFRQKYLSVLKSIDYPKLEYK